MSSNAESLERMYELFRWPEDIRKSSGRKRYEESLKDLAVIAAHDWIKEVLERERVRIVDICSGTGIGGIALAKRIAELGKEVELTFVDLRTEALRKAAEFSKAELGLEARTVDMDARKLYELELEADIALLLSLF
ncbi:MAG: class I SAM-dependent methyltransferase [Candidatus Methanodesulfokora sp.]